MAVALIAALLLAHDCPSPSPRVQDRVFAAELVAGGPASLGSYEVSLEMVGGSEAFPRGAPVVEVTQSYGLSLPHGDLTVALASNQDGELDTPADEVFNPKPYSPDRWSVTCLRASADTKTLPWRDVIGSKENLSGTRGSLIFTVPASARLIELRYRIRAFADQGEVGLGFSPNALRSWGEPPNTFVVTMNGLGDLPATHFDVQLASGLGQDAKPYEGRRPAWTFSRGSLVTKGERRYPPALGVRRPNLGPCPPRDCKMAGTLAGLERHCLATSGCDICSANHHRSSAMKYWLGTSVATGRFDARSLSLARNWIYARHGQVFRTQWLKEYFAAQPWYCPSGEVPEGALDDDERAAVRLLRELEAKAEGVDARQTNSPSRSPGP